jgi:hypothetical protein
MKIAEIIQGTLNKVVGVNKDLMLFRTEYGCKRCAIGFVLNTVVKDAQLVTMPKVIIPDGAEGPKAVVVAKLMHH